MTGLLLSGGSRNHTQGSGNNNNRFGQNATLDNPYYSNKELLTLETKCKVFNVNVTESKLSYDQSLKTYQSGVNIGSASQAFAQVMSKLRVGQKCMG
jgi:hypothetical protein